ncbi:alpha-mannosidase [Prevotella sp. oral taxon 376]|uniref:GH92 family glycosyl hydrolase n=1 Tax=Prevotella sp. oral taxon 376 TaxID=712466 RepID=UPI000D1D6B0B|nr:GH92 family glycosyl hydrolase [Prevotella sp. oral taxon 376]PTL34187.1 alpha-mannosidase [Prevotella sp. oral taxon 376]
MKLISKILILAVAVVAASPMQAAPKGAVDYTQYVNPWVGTGGHGHVFLGANVPNGLVQLGPTEPTRGWDWCSGYHYSDNVLLGFSHMHLSGTGIGDLGDITFLPVKSVEQDSVYFTHQEEAVRPGYYAIDLKDAGVKVELTATRRAGFHRYTFTGKQGFVKLNLKHGIGWDALTSCKLVPVGDDMVVGYRKSTGWAKNQQVYFAAKFNTKVRFVGCEDNVFTLEVGDVSKPVLVKVGLSAVSEKNAEINLDAEIPAWDFDGAVRNATNAWNKALGKIQIQTHDATARRIFYTAMYHSMVAPSVFSDVNGEYRGADYKVHKGDFTNYTTFSLWDTYRAKMPLMTLIHPDLAADVAKTFMNIYREQGKLPVWHLVGNETDCMVGNPGVAVLADLVLKGFVRNREAAFQALRQSAMKDDRGLDLYKQYGYIPLDLDPTYETVAKHLEYALADAGVAKVAKLLGHQDDYEYFRKRAESYRRLFDPADCFLKGVDSKGNFRTPFNPFHAVHRQDDYTEGNAWQYNWLVPHDVHGLVSLFPSEKAFVSKLDSLFIVSGDMGAEASPDISGLIGQYAHGNEPSHHIIYMYNYVGQPWKAADLVRETLSTMYKDDFDGLSGNEDVGQMSAWYVISSMGLYQVEPEGGRFIFGSPIWDSAKLDLGNGKTFEIVAHDNSAANKYIQSCKLNGRKYTKSYIDYADIVKGGRLEFVMGAKPSKFGTARKDRP